MSGMIGKAIKALLDDGNHWRAICAKIGEIADRKHFRMSRRTAVPGDGSKPIYAFELTFGSQEELLRFAECLDECIQASKE